MNRFKEIVDRSIKEKVGFIKVYYYFKKPTICFKPDLEKILYDINEINKIITGNIDEVNKLESVAELSPFFKHKKLDFQEHILNSPNYQWYDNTIRE